MSQNPIPKDPIHISLPTLPISHWYEVEDNAMCMSQNPIPKIPIHIGLPTLPISHDNCMTHGVVFPQESAVANNQQQLGKLTIVQLKNKFKKKKISRAQRVPEPDPIPGISFDTRPDSVLKIIG